MKKWAGKSFSNISSWVVVAVLVASILGFALAPRAEAATSGKLTLYLKPTVPDINEAYNALTLSPQEDINGGGILNNISVNATPPTSFCTGFNSNSDNVTSVQANASPAGNYCISTFISSPVGQTITMSTADAASITGHFWSKESASQVTEAFTSYIYRWNGSGTTVNSSDRIATVTCPDPGTSITLCSPTAVAPANNITFSATDRIVVIATLNVTGARSGANGLALIENGANNPAYITMNYTMITPNKPALTGSMDDDFTTAAATTACTTGGGVHYNTKWTCLQGTAVNTAGSFNAEDTSATGSGDSSSWLWLSNSNTATTAVPSDFGTTPSNTFLYQSMPAAYNTGTIRTVVNSSALFDSLNTSATTPYNHTALTLWKSNTDYLEVQVYAVGAGRTSGGLSTNNVGVALNNSGTFSGATSLNPTSSSGIFNEVWLGLSYDGTTGTWQAQYSTDGTTWNNIGSAVAHNTFSRVGLDAFCDIANPITSYGGAFEWLQSTLTNPVYNQVSSNWFANADSATPGSPFTGQNLEYILTSSGEQFRLRQLMKVQGQVSLIGQFFSEQFAPLGSASSCVTIPSGNWADIGLGTGAIAYFDNPTPGGGAPISATVNDPTDGSQTVAPDSYVTADDFTNVYNEYGATIDAEWDLSLVDNGAPSGTIYCLRTVKFGTDTPLDIYTNYPMIITMPATDQLLRGGEFFSPLSSKAPFFWAE